MLDNFSNVAQAYKHAGQAPLDAKYLIEDVSELHTTAPNESRAYSFYDGYMCYVYPLKEFYIWRDRLDKISPDDMITESLYLYPNGSEYGGIDYSGKQYAFVKLNIGFGSDSDAENYDIGDLIALYINLSSEKGLDVLNPTDENIHNPLNSLLDYITFYFKRNNLLHFVDNLFAFTTNIAMRKELDDKYRSNSMYYVLGNHVTVDDLENPTMVTLQSQRLQGTPTQIGLGSHNGFMHNISRSIYNIIKAEGIGYLDLQSHDGHFVSFKFTSEDTLFVRGNPFSVLGPEMFRLATFIQITGKKDSSYGDLMNKPVKVRVRSVYGRNNNLNLPGTQIPIKEAIIGFTKKEIEDNSFIMTHNLNVDRYISEVFSYPPSIYNDMVPVTLTPKELQESRIISNYGPNDANTIYLQDIDFYKDEDEDEVIYYLVKYIERQDYELIMPTSLSKIIQLNNDPDEPVVEFDIEKELLSTGFYSPYGGTGDFDVSKIHITNISDEDPNYPEEILTYEGDEISPLPAELTYEDIFENLKISVKASGGNRVVKTFNYYIEDFQGRFSNPVEFTIIKEGFDPDSNTPPIINPTLIVDGYGSILAQWNQTVRLTSLGQYYMQAIPYDADSNYYGNPEAPGELEVRFEIIRQNDNFVVLDETMTGIRSEQMVMLGFSFPDDQNINPNNIYTFIFRFTVTDPQGASNTVERKLITIY